MQYALVLADIIICTIDVQLLESREPSGWHVLLVLCPRDSTLFKQIYDRRDVLGDMVRIVVVHPIIVSSDRGDIVRL